MHMQFPLLIVSPLLFQSVALATVTFNAGNPHALDFLAETFPSVKAP